MTPCEFEVLIGPYHDRELDEQRAAEMAQHIVECRSCARQLAEVRRISGVIGRIPLDPISGSERSRVYRVVDQLPRSLAERAMIRMAGGLAAVAASVLIVTSICLIGTGAAPAIPQGSHPAIIAVNLSQNGAWPDQANSNLSHWMVRNLGGELP